MNRQDIRSSTIVGTRRIVDYTFYPQRTAEDLLDKSSRVVPFGSLSCQDVLNEDILEATADINALCSLNLTVQGISMNAEMAARVDARVGGIQTWLESRLQDLRQNTTHPIRASCILATFLCVYGF